MAEDFKHFPGNPTCECDVCFDPSGLPPWDDLLRLLDGVKIKFWDCPINHPREPQRERIRWEGDVATCLDCGLTNQEGF